MEFCHFMYDAVKNKRLELLLEDGVINQKYFPSVLPLNFEISFCSQLGSSLFAP